MLNRNIFIMEIVNKYFKRKLGVDAPAKITNVDGGFAIFENGARCKLDTLLSEFEQVQITQIQEQKIVNNNNVEIDPEAFFNTPLTDPSILNQLEELVKNPDMKIERTTQDMPSVDLTTNKVIGQSNNNGEPQPPASMMKNGQGPKDMFAARLNGEENPMGDQQPGNQYIPPVVRTEPAEYEVFNNVKLTDELELTIPLTIRVPKAHKVDVLNDMFKTPFVEFLADREVSAILKNKKAFMDLIVEQLEGWLDDELDIKSKKGSKKKTGKKLVSRSIVEKKVTKKTVDKITEVKLVETKTSETPSGAIPTQINSQEDLEKIRTHVTNLYTLPESPKVDKEILMYEDMAALYIASTTQTQ